MSKILLDTNAYSDLCRGDERVLDELDQASAVLMSVVVIGELCAGFRGGSRYLQNMRDLDDFLADRAVEMIPVSRDTAEIFGELKAQLKTEAKPLPINDVWIASQCIEHGAVLVSYDTHFERISGLRRWRI